MLRATHFLLAALLASGCAAKVAPQEPLLVEKGLRVIRGGHATVWLDLNGFRLLADPVFTAWLGPFKRNDALGLDPENLPPVDAVVISHTHMDHYDPWSIDKIPGRVPTLFPAAVSVPATDPAYLYDLVKRQPVYEARWWRSYEVRNREGRTARITAVPAAHWAGRFGFDGLWNDTYGGWVIESGGYTVYFAGDTGWDPAMFRSIGKRFPKIDLALMPIGPVLWRDAESNRMEKRHVNPPQALEAFRLVGAKHMIPIHYGSFFQSPVGPDVPLEWLQELMADAPDADRIAVIEPGALWRFPSQTAIVQNNRPAPQHDTLAGN